MTETDSRATNAGGDGRFQLHHRRLHAIISNQIRIISNQIRSNSNHFHSNGPVGACRSRSARYRPGWMVCRPKCNTPRRPMQWRAEFRNAVKRSDALDQLVRKLAIDVASGRIAVF